MQTTFNIATPNNFVKFKSACHFGKSNSTAPVQFGQFRQSEQGAQNQPAPVQTPEKALLTIAALQGVTMVLDTLSSGASAMLMRGKEFTTAVNSVKIAENMAKNHNLNVGIEFIKNTTESIQKVSSKYRIAPDMLKPVAEGRNAFYADAIKLAVAPASKPSLMLHELGHACNAKNVLLKGLQKSRSIVAFLPMIAGILSQTTPRNKDGKPGFIERNAGKIGFAAFVPTLIEEGAASIRGINAAKHAQAAMGKLDLKPLIRNYAFAWSTYLLAGIGLGIATRLAFAQNRALQGKGTQNGFQGIKS